MSQTPPDITGQGPSEPAQSVGTLADKVELDLDDAPFLQEEAPPEPEKKPVPEQDKPPAESAARPSPQNGLKERLLLRLLSDKKRLIIAGVSAAALLTGAVAVNIFLFGESGPTPAPTPESCRILVPDAPAPPPPASVSQHTLSWDPFWVEQRDDEGATRFLICRFTIPTDNETLYAEMQQKKIVLRDAFFYYLRNLPLTPLNSEAATRKFKQELMTVVNEHMGSGKIEDIYIEEYLIK